VFADATVETCVFVFERIDQSFDRSDSKIIIERLDANGNAKFEREFRQKVVQEAHLYNFQLHSRERSTEIVDKIKTVGQPLADFVNFVYGFKTADDEKFIHTTKKHKESQPFIRSAAVMRFSNDVPIEYVWYVPDQMTRNRKTARPGDAVRFETEKIIVARMGKALIATYDSGGLYVKDAMLLLSKDKSHSLRYLLGLINSRLLNYFYQEFFVTIDVLKNALLSLPIRRINFTDPTDKARHDKMVQLVESMLALHKHKAVARTQAEQEQIQRQIDATDRQIDTLVYELYGLTADEIAVVEGAG
jgi:hypothetical protein